MSIAAPSIWYLLGTQAMSVLGDAFGQRSLRTVFHGKRRHMLIAISFVSSLQVVIFLGAFQIFAPALTSNVYIGHTLQPCFEEVDIEGYSPCYCNRTTLGQSFIEGFCNSTSHPITPFPNCTEITCPSQGPGSIWYSIFLHPLLLLNGLQDILYYVGEIWLYREPLGLVIIVVAALASTFIINPFGEALGLKGSVGIPAAVLVLGIVGALLGTIEIPPPQNKSLREMYRDILCCCRRKKMTVNEEDEENVEPLLGSASDTGKDEAAARDSHEKRGLSLVDVPTANTGVKTMTTRQRVAWALRCLFPFFLLSVTYCAWFVTQKVFNNVYRTNVWGYTTIDQALLPFYLLPAVFLLGLCRPFSLIVTSKEEGKESFGSAFVSCFREMFTETKGLGFLNVFFYRLLTNTRAMIYFILSIQYDLESVYMELNLVKVIMSWAGALFMSAVVPKFLCITKEEQRATFAPLNILIHVIGSVLVVIALWLFNSEG